jgi:hypothetical protein
VNQPEKTADASEDDRLSVHEILLRVDLATEVLEGLDELGLESRSQVEELVTRLEAQIADAT